MEMVQIDEQSASVLEAVAEYTESELILFFIIAAIIAIPVCIFIHSENKRRDKREAERHGELMAERRQLMEVIAENSSVQAQLKATLEAFGEKNVKSLERVHARIDDNTKEQTAIKENIRDILKNANDILALLNRKGGD